MDGISQKTEVDSRIFIHRAQQDSMGKAVYQGNTGSQ